jgi:signal transduction histidine kinase
LIHSSLYSFFPPTFDKKLLQEKLVSNEDLKEEIELVTKSGSIRYCLLSFSKEINDLGESYLQGIAYDISKLKEEEKEKIHRGKMDMAEHIARALAHEIRNPLTNIDLAVDQLTYEIDAGTTNIYLEIINRNSKRITTLITELLRGSSNITLVDNNLQQILEESIAVVKDRIMLKRIIFNANYPKEAITVKADPGKLTIAFINIIINAIEAIEPDTGKLTIELKKENSMAVIIIQDNGCGIKEENIPHLFEAYYTNKKNGLGLGLSTTYNIITSHNGSLKVTSKINEGTRFIINIPVS